MEFPEQCKECDIKDECLKKGSEIGKCDYLAMRQIIEELKHGPMAETKEPHVDLISEATSLVNTIQIHGVNRIKDLEAEVEQLQNTWCDVTSKQSAEIKRLQEALIKISHVRDNDMTSEIQDSKQAVEIACKALKDNLQT